MFRSHSSGIGRAARRRLFSLQQLEQRRLLAVDLPDLISRNAAGTGTAELAADMTTASLSADGRFHVFETAAADVVSSDDNNASDVFLRDLLLGTTELISRSGNGGTANNHSRRPSISGDGEYVVFSSTATDLDVTGSSSSNAFSQIYRWQRVTGAIELISVNAAANGGGNQASFNPSVSSDGQRIAFVTQADDLVSGVVDGNSSYDVYLRDLRSTPTTILVSHHHAQPLSTGDGWSGGELPIKLSRDGTRVVYISQATDLEAGLSDNNDLQDLVVFTIDTGLNHYATRESADAVTANSGSTRSSQSLSGDGRYQVFSTSANNVVPGDINSVSDVFLRDLISGDVMLISRSDNGGTGNAESGNAVISADGQYVAFTSRASNLATSGTASNNGIEQVYRWHRPTGTLTLVSRNSGGINGGNAASSTPSISGDGAVVAYGSRATNLVASMFELNGEQDIFAANFSGSVPVTQLVSRSYLNPLNTGDGAARLPRVTLDGSRVFYLTQATDVSATVTDINTAEELVVFERSTGSNSHVALPDSAPTTANAESFNTGQSLSADGRYHVFTSRASNLAAGDVNQSQDVFLKDLQTGQVTLVSRSFLGGSANSISNDAVISADGHYVAFSSFATDLDVTGVNATFGYSQVFRWQRTTGELTLVSIDADGLEGGLGNAYRPTISGDGGRIAYFSDAANLIDGGTDTNNWTDVFVRDMASETTVLASAATATPLVTANSYSYLPKISRDGSTVVYLSAATNLADGVGDGNGSGEDLFAFSIDSAVNTAVNTAVNLSTGGTQTSSAGVAAEFDLSADGQLIAFSSQAVDLHLDDIDPISDVFLRDLSDPSGVIELISVDATGLIKGNAASRSPSLSGDGAFVAFLSQADNLSPDDNNTRNDVYVRTRAPLTPDTTLISRSASAAGAANNHSFAPRISFDGAVIAFDSDATDLDPLLTDDNATRDVYVARWQLATPTIDLLSRSAQGTHSANGMSHLPVPSDDGEVVLFTSLATDASLATDINGAATDIFAFRDNVVQLVSAKAAVTTGSQGVSTNYDISDTGQFVAFESSSPGLVVNVLTGTHVYVRDLSNPQLQLIDVNQLGNTLGNASAPRISGDGRYVAFQSSGALDPLDSGNGVDVYVRDRAMSQTVLVSVNAGGVGGGDGNSSAPEISRDGSMIAFVSTATNLDSSVSDTNQLPDAFIRDWQQAMPATHLVSRRGGAMVSGSGASSSVELSDSGERLVFNSLASNMVANVADINQQLDIFAYDGTAIAVVSARGDGDFAAGLSVPSVGFDISDSGRFVAFASAAQGIAPIATHGAAQVYVVDIEEDAVHLISSLNNGAAGENDSLNPSLSGDGRFIAFESLVAFDPLDSLGFRDIYVVDRETATTRLVSIDADAAASGNGDSFAAHMSRDGQMIAFLSAASNLDHSVMDANAATDAFLRSWNGAMPRTDLLSRNAAGSSAAEGAERVVLSDSGLTTVIGSQSDDLTSLNDTNQALDLFAVRVDLLPTVTRILASSTTWQPSFIDTIDGDGDGVGGGNGKGIELVSGMAPLVWDDVDRIYIYFSENVALGLGQTLELRDSAGPLPVTVVYDSLTFMATVELASPLSFSKLRLAVSDGVTDDAGNALDGDGDGMAGGIFDLRFDVAPADRTGDGRIGVSDLLGFGVAFNAQAGQATYDPYLDWNGDGRVSTGDLQVFTRFYNQQLSFLADPGAPFGGGGSSMGMAFGAGPGSGHDAFFASITESDDEAKEGRDSRFRSIALL